MLQLATAGSSNGISLYLPALWKRIHKRSVWKKRKNASGSTQAVVSWTSIWYPTTSTLWL